MIVFFLLGFLQADYNEKGMHVYKKICKSCHGSGDYGARQLEEAQWEDYFLFHAQKLKKVHENSEDIYKKIKELSPKKLASLESFLVGNAKDSGSVGG
jgi:mono/diheme cytochrome c family protein